MQTNIAKRLNITERSVRRIEEALVDFNFVRKDVGLSGRRYCINRHDGSPFRQGLVLSPLIEAIPHLVEVEKNLDADIQERRELKLKISAGTQRAKTLLMNAQSARPDDARVKSFTEIFLNWPRRFPASVGQSDLREHLDTVLQLVDKMEIYISELEQESPYPDSGVPRFIQDTTQDQYVSCNEVVDNMTACQQADIPYHAPPIGDANCLESKSTAAAEHDNTEDLSWLTPQKLYQFCSDEMKLRVLLSQGDKDEPSGSDFVNGVIDRLRPLGINYDAYDTAVAEMGAEKTAICVLIIDRNRFHPQTPIKNPGGVLRAMTKRHSEGDLRLNASLIALAKRGYETM
jgi:replication initiation protein RepC